MHVITPEDIARRKAQLIREHAGDEISDPPWWIVLIGFAMGYLVFAWLAFV